MASLFSYQADANGYTIFYRGRLIGGAGVKLPRETRLHWRHAQSNVRDNGEDARREIAALQAGDGQRRFRDAMALIEGEAVTP